MRRRHKNHASEVLFGEIYVAGGLGSGLRIESLSEDEEEEGRFVWNDVGKMENSQRIACSAKYVLSS